MATAATNDDVSEDDLRAKEMQLLDLQRKVRALETQLRAAGSPIVESPAAGLGATDPSSPSAARAPPALSGHPSFAFQNGAGSSSSSGNAHPHIVTGGVASPSHSSVGDDGSPVRTVHVTGAGGGAGADDSLLDAASALDSTGGSLGSTGASVSPGGAGGGGGGGARSRPQTAMSRTAQTSQDKFVAKVGKNLSKLQHGRKPAVLVCTGNFNPVHMQHVRIFYIAREFLQKHHGYQIVGGLMSPKHDSEVRRTVRTQTTYSIPSRHRVGMCEAAVDSSSWLAVDRWAVTRKLVMDYPSVLGNVKQVLTKAFPKETPAVIYLCGADDLVRSIGRMRMTCVCVARPGYMDELRRAVGKKHRALVHVVDDDSVLTTVVDSLSSTKVRRRFGQGKPVDDMVGADVVAYLNKYSIADKSAGRTKWSKADKQAVTI